MPANGKSPLLLALTEKRVKAEMVDLDHYRIRGGMAVETDYIIKVEPKVENQAKKNSDEQCRAPEFETYYLSKTYSAFRTLGHQLKKASNAVTGSDEKLPKTVQKLAQYCETVIHLVETQRTQYLGKVNYNYVTVLAKKRSHIINEVLEATLNYFPDETESNSFHEEVAETILTFFLTDFCVEEDTEQKWGSSGSLPAIPNPFRTPSKRYVSDENRKNSTLAAKPKAGGSDGDPLSESLNNVGQAVGHAVENVGNFLKERLGDRTKQPETRERPTTLDTALRSPVVPYTRKNRRSILNRDKDMAELQEIGEEANLLLDDDRPQAELVPSYSYPIPTFGSPGSKLGDVLETNPMIFSAIFVASATLLRHAAKLTVSMDLDIQLLLVWAAFCIGLHTPRPMVGGIDKSTTPALVVTQNTRIMRKKDRHGRQLLRKSMVTSPDAKSAAAIAAAGIDGTNRSFSAIDNIAEEDSFDDIMEVGQSPMNRFPDGAPLGSKLNCWSEPEAENFQVRGANYLADRVKEASGPFIFPVRAVDLFLTDTCPENAGSNGGVLGGNLREKPTFIINFRLPWGILLSYFEIPERFIPFIRAAHEEGFDKSTLPSMDEMTPSERCVARFCQDPQEKKNKKLKIVPIVVEGPWVVKSVVGGKPALIGNKLPVNYHYAPAEEGKAMYLEADLDIVGSSAARGILSVARTYTQVLTLDLGFVVQGNSEDELPEQMLVGTRLHGIDPLTAPPYPPTKDRLMDHVRDMEDESEDEI